jgi:hypothetical protein
MNSMEEEEMPDPHALTVKRRAVTIMTFLRPNRSARLPAKKAPPAHPRSMEATLKPDAASEEWKATLRAPTVPLMTPLSNPKRNPPMAAMALIRMINPVFDLSDGVVLMGCI